GAAAVTAVDKEMEVPPVVVLDAQFPEDDVRCLFRLGAQVAAVIAAGISRRIQHAVLGAEKLVVRWIAQDEVDPAVVVGRSLHAAAMPGTAAVLGLGVVD